MNAPKRKEIVIASATQHRAWFERFRRPDVLLPALAFVHQQVNEHLAGAVTPRLEYDGENGGQYVELLPQNLLAALWLQFALAVAGDKDYRDCEVCATPFEVSLDAARADRVFCSNACRSKAYRQRQEKARRLYVEGKTARAIAKELGSDLATVKKWINQE
jgi:hypothetical protein